MTNHTEHQSVLGEQIAKRLDQLGMSRREFCRRFNISRQTLHELEHNPDKQFAPSTFEAIDQGLKWQGGTAQAFHEGNPNARETVGDMSTTDRMESYLTAIMHQLLTMDIDELEREVLLLEEEAMVRRPKPSVQRTEQIEVRIQQLVTALIHAQLGG